MVQPARPDGPRSDERYRHVFEDGPVGIWLVDGNLQTLEMNGAMSRMLGYTAEELGQRTFADVTHPDDIEGNLALRCQLIAGDVSTFTVEKRYVTKSGNPIWVELTVTAVRDDFNRRYMDEPLQRELARAARNHSCVAVLAIDVDHFKAFNDAYGHSAGDALLTSFGAMLRDRTRSEDIACRSGGEEFNVILPDCPLGDAVERADALRAAGKGLEVGVRGRTYGGLTISVGVAVFPDHGGDSATLLEEADTALYRAKAEGRDRVCAARVLLEQSDDVEDGEVKGDHHAPYAEPHPHEEQRLDEGREGVDGGADLHVAWNTPGSHFRSAKASRSSNESVTATAPQRPW